MKCFKSASCCCCFRKKKKEKGDEIPRHVPYRQPVAVHDIVADKNGSHKNETYSNKAFQQEERIETHQPSLNGATEDLLPPYGRQRQESLISNLSVVFQAPNVDEKSLGELVIEEFNHKSKTLHSVSSDDNSASRTTAGDVISAAAESSQANNTTNSCDVNKTLLSRQHSPQSLNRDDTKSKNSPSFQNAEEKVIEDKTNNTTASSEWRDKLKSDLLNDDDDEEFIESSEESNEDLLSSSASSISCDSDDEVDFNIKEQRRKTRRVISQSSINKLLNQRALVIDNGSYLVRAGWAGQFSPASCTRNVIGHWRAEASEAWQEALGSKFIGNKAIERHSTLALDRPIEDGKIGNWKGLREVWDHVANVDLNTELVQQPVLITEPAFVDRKQREKMVEVFIETLHVPGACLRSQAAMCALSAGQKVGLVVNCGYGTTEVVPIYEGYHLDYVTTNMGIGGRHLTDYLARLVHREHGVSFTSVAELEIINKIKEKYARVEADSKQNKSALESDFEYELPDGQIVQLGSELSSCTEPLFRPGLVGNAAPGLPTVIKHTLDRLDPDILAEGNNRVLLTGGGSNLMGLQERLESDLPKAVGGADIIVQSSTCGDNAAWVGGSLLADQTGFSEMCLTEDMYFEHGASIVHRFCL